MTHLRIWVGRDGDVYFAGKIAAADADYVDPFTVGVFSPASAIPQAEELKRAFEVTVVREEAQKHDRPNRRDRP